MSLTFERTRDRALVRELVTAPGSWEAATDDNSPAAAEWEPHEDDRVFYIVATEDEKPIGLFTLIPQNAVCFEIHVTRAFGTQAIAAGRGVVRWIFEHTPARRIVASIPSANRLAMRYAVACGFSQYGRNPRSFARRGALIDQILYGISPDKEKTPCRAQ